MLRRVLPTCSRLRREMAMGMATKATDDTHITSAAVREAKLLVSTRDCVEGRQIVKELGVVSATVVRTKNILEDILAALGGMFGGETRSYSSLMNETTQEAIHRLKGAALAQGASAVVMTKFETNTTMNRFVFGLHCTVLVYGTAVVCRPIVKKST